jgi:hypothetical protein
MGTPDYSNLIFLISRNRRPAVIGLVTAFGLRAGEEKLSSSGRLRFAFTAIECKQNWRPALLTLDPEVPPRIGFGPL